MRHPRHWLHAAIALLAISGAALTNAAAETIHLTNGTTIDGEIISRSERGVTIRTAGGTMTIAHGRIDRIEESAPGTIEFQRADEAFRQGRLSEAERLFEMALEAGADKAVIDERMNQILERRAGEELRDHGPALKEAQDARAKGDYAKAEASYRHLLSLLPPTSALRTIVVDELAAMHIGRGEHFRDTVNDAAAIDEFRKALELTPGRGDAYLALGLLYAKNSRTRDLAIAHLQRGLDFGEDDMDRRELAALRYRLAELQRDAGNHLAAFEGLLAVRDAGFHSQEPRLEPMLLESCARAAMAMAPQDPEAASDLLNRGLQVRLTPDLLIARAQIEVANGNIMEGIRTYEQVIAVDPTQRNVNYDVAQLYLRQFRTADARRHLEREIQVWPENYQALCDLGDLAVQRDDIEAAEQYYSRANRVDDDRPARSWVSPEPQGA